MVEKNIVNKKTKNGNITSIVFLGVVIVATIILYFYNNKSLNEIESIKENITSRESIITDLENETDLQIYFLLELNKKIINSYKVMNNVTSYINHMNDISSKYNLKFTGFNFLNGEITTNTRIISDKKSIAYQKTRDFINNYRNDSERLFNLDFINSIEGMDEMNFKVNFKIK